MNKTLMNLIKIKYYVPMLLNQKPIYQKTKFKNVWFFA